MWPQRGAGGRSRRDAEGERGGAAVGSRPSSSLAEGPRRGQGRARARKKPPRELGPRRGVGRASRRRVQTLLPSPPALSTGSISAAASGDAERPAVQGPGQGPHLEGLVRLRQQQPRGLVQVHLEQDLRFEGPQLGKGRAIQASPGLSVCLHDLREATARATSDPGAGGSSGRGAASVGRGTLLREPPPWAVLPPAPRTSCAEAGPRPPHPPPRAPSTRLTAPCALSCPGGTPTGVGRPLSSCSSARCTKTPQYGVQATCCTCPGGRARTPPALGCCPPPHLRSAGCGARDGVPSAALPRGQRPLTSETGSWGRVLAKVAPLCGGRAEEGHFQGPSVPPQLASLPY